jgi:hypothetical protein
VAPTSVVARFIGLWKTPDESGNYKFSSTEIAESGQSVNAIPELIDYNT